MKTTSGPAYEYAVLTTARMIESDAFKIIPTQEVLNLFKDSIEQAFLDGSEHAQRHIGRTPTAKDLCEKH